MADLPRGTWAFLFTDIAGSTRLWEHYPVLMRSALARHDDILRGSFAAHGGVVFGTAGDAFSTAFPTLDGAVAAAVAAQQALLAEPWATPKPIRVRMALHWGPAERRGESFFGPPTLNRLARLLTVTHAGQILLTGEAAAPLAPALPAGIALRDLGLHRLRDVRRAEPIFQLLAPGLPDHFPPPPTLDTQPHNLPVPPGPLLGRAADLAAATALLGQPGVRMLTLTGPGGIGKTHLALQLAADVIDQFPDGVWFVDLAPLRDAGLVAAAIGAALDVQESPGTGMEARLIEHLHGKRLLLVLDNFEQVIPATGLVSDLLAAGPGIKVLATSRAVLHLYGEYEYSVPPLAVPDAGAVPAPAVLQAYPSVALFLARATAVNPAFQLTADNAAAVADLCQQLDGLPLALELAAARSQSLTPAELLAHLGEALGGAGLPEDPTPARPARQETLEATLDWSYGLLAPPEQVLFAALAVFAGGSSLEAAEAVAGDQAGDFLDALTGLVDKSLLRQTEEADGSPRFAMLGTIQQYARARLAEHPEAELLRERHAAYYLAFADAAAARSPAEHAVAWDALEGEHPNLRAAFDWAIERGEAATALRLGAALWRFWQVRGYWTEGRRRLAAALLLPDPGLDATRAQVLHGAGVLADGQSDRAATAALLEASLALYRRVGDPAGSADVLYNLGWAAINRGAAAEARALAGESLALHRAAGDRHAVARTLHLLAVIGTLQEDYVTAAGLLEESLALGRQLGDRHALARVLNALGEVLRSQGSLARAEPLYREALGLYRAIGSKWGTANVLHNLGHVTLAAGNTAEAEALFQESLALHRELDEMAGSVLGLAGLAGVAVARGEAERAARLLGAVATWSVLAGVRLDPADRAAHAAYAGQARAVLDAAIWDAAWAAGRELSLEAAVAEAAGGKGKPVMPPRVEGGGWDG
ncbi:MAG TPA: tetratricopeptide repeat protein [Chloroflexia bacterium]|nr:tetratricopeptide repeat protein [Chloroflexia bacterium]